ncbi:hypothetical protein [Miltoncostaea oceani]|uniref:hypothetical protein n=1 Tax=Miltoncostaea oceani TaxID=2843216 RepID=UPI001C3D65FC|nr:hypothetical protein [Miltoncostaea oceani]
MTTHTHPTPRRRAARAAALLAGIACLALPGSAVADSIVYIDGGDVWSARPDGSGKVKLTDGGDWHSPTQADDGTIAAVKGTGPIQVMARDGRPIRTITTPPARSGDGGTFAPRPVQLSFSPDGTRIAYAYVANSCPVASSCGTIQRSTFYTRADVTDATPHSVWGNQFGVSDPEWVTNDRTLVFGGYGSQVSIDDLGPGDYSQTPWMTPNADQGDGELSRDGTRLATTFFYGADTVIAFFAVTGDPRTQLPPPLPQAACTSTPPDAAYSDPSWSPDGTSIAIRSSAGIEVLRFARLAPGDCSVASSAVLTATGHSPDWGPADPAPARWTPPAGGGAPPAGGPGPVAGAARVALTTPRATRAALRAGLVVRVRTPAAGRVRVTVTSAGRTIATGTRRVARPGAVAVRLTKVPRVRAVALRGRTVRIVATVVPARGPRLSVARTVRVR